MADVPTITATELMERHRGLLRGDGTELALIDAREPTEFTQRHLLYAANLPLSHVGLEVAARIPRLGTSVVICDDGGREAAAVALELTVLGYADTAVLDGGIDAWAAAGGELYSGINVPSKLFGELVEEHFGTPQVTAAELDRWLADGRDLVVLDSRTRREFNRMSIPTGRSCPGGELVRRVHDLIDDSTTVVVNCAGRTRSILGAQSLRSAGLPNAVYALKDGTMGWELAGLKLEHGRDQLAPEPSDTGRAEAAMAAQTVAQRCGVRTVDRAALDDWLADGSRTTYFMDVRTPEEFASGQLAGAVGAPGGQLVQATDEYLVTRGARVVLADGDGIGATMTASWLIQMGWDAWVLEPGWTGDAELVTQSGDETASAIRSRQPPLPYDPTDAAVAKAAMEAYLVWEVALPDQYARDDLAEFRFC
ncbi:MAG: rhodanese-related sulfurtransferase [Acidimicrobiales bacterium]|nr:rhodanese-related sulfurtransferase [Acidimicrobiales bacterium]MYH75524.1 rhodanese-related sulfurtransferase [Acidimicrobiales bacterium]MYK70300.1 rhodanese-related sulfurtransferase [Acidimicrobiales bacterium]